SFAPAEPTRAQAPLSLPEDAMLAPDGSDALFVRTGNVAVQGDGLSPEAIAALRDRIAQKRVSVADIFAAAREAEAAEARRGKVLVRVLVPRQDLSDDAPVRIVVIEGFVERVDVSGVPAGVRDRVAALLGDLEGRPDIRLPEIERR